MGSSYSSHAQRSNSPALSASCALAFKKFPVLQVYCLVVLQGSSQPPTKTAQLHFKPGHPALTPPAHPAALMDPIPLSAGSVPAPAAQGGRAKDGCRPQTHVPVSEVQKLAPAWCFPPVHIKTVSSSAAQPWPGVPRVWQAPSKAFSTFFFFPKHFFPNLNHHLSSWNFFFSNFSTMPESWEQKGLLIESNSWHIWKKTRIPLPCCNSCSDRQKKMPMPLSTAQKPAGPTGSQKIQQNKTTMLISSQCRGGCRLGSIRERVRAGTRSALPQSQPDAGLEPCTPHGAAFADSAARLPISYTKHFLSATQSHGFLLFL